MANVLVICEIKDGKLKKASREALSIGRKIAEAAGGELQAAVLGSSASSLAEEAGKFGAKTLFAAGDASLDQYGTESWTAAAKAAVEAASPGVVLLGATAAGMRGVWLDRHDRNDTTAEAHLDLPGDVPRLRSLAQLPALLTPQ